MTTTLATIAARLRKVADALDVAHVDLPVSSAYLSITPDYILDQGKRVARVDAVAALLGLTAAPTKNGGTWYHEARDDRDGIDLRVYAHIKAPAQRCACGAECTHTSPAGVR